MLEFDPIDEEAPAGRHAWAVSPTTCSLQTKNGPLDFQEVA